MTALSTLVPALQRELAVPGTFDDMFPSTTEEDLTASLADGFGEAQLQGFFPTITLDPDGTDWESSEDLSASGGTLVVLFTATRILRAQIRALNASERYKAGPTEFEISRSSNVLRDELAYLTKRLDDLIKNAQAAARAARSATVHDNYLARGGGVTIGAGFYDYECRG